MKVLLIVCNSAIENEVMNTFGKTGIQKYTKFQNVLGQGGRSEPHLDNPVWPGTNLVFLIAVDEATLGKILKELKSLKKQFEKAGLKAMVLPLEEIL